MNIDVFEGFYVFDVFKSCVDLMRKMFIDDDDDNY